MAMDRQKIYLDHENIIKLRLKNKGEYQPLANMTQISITLGSDTVYSADKASGVITWDQAGYLTGEIRLDLAGETLTGGEYESPIVVYDAPRPEGIVWGSIPTEVVPEFENPP